MGGLCCHQRKSQKLYNAHDTSLHDLGSDEVALDWSQFDPVAYVPGRIRLHSKRVPSIGEETSIVIPMRDQLFDQNRSTDQDSGDEDAPEGSHQFNNVPERIQLNYPSAPIPEKETSIFGELIVGIQSNSYTVASIIRTSNSLYALFYRSSPKNGTVSCTSDGDLSKKSSALFCAAIDFGTTYTGYAFSSRKDPKKVLSMSSEQGSSKVPTVVLFDQNKTFHSFGYKAEERYQQLLRQDNHNEWYLFKEFKMTLFQTEKLTERTPVRDFQGKIETPAIDVFTSAIEFMKEKLLIELNTNFSDVRGSDIHWVLTVPAIWNDSAKQFMRKAATKAGISDEMLSLALEPEAASIYCRQTFSRVCDVGTRYILLDHGGGTADLTCHKVVDGGLKALKNPEGGGFGGTDVDAKFKKLLVDIFGLKTIKTFKTKYLNEFWEMLADFEMSKRKFDGKDGLKVKFPARIVEIYGEHESIDDVLQRTGYSEDIKIKRGKMHISKHKGRWIFDGTIDQVIERTQSLLNALENVDYIVLVGGFSESKYLQTRMKEEFGDKVVAPTEPRTAVMRGAVLFGQSPASIQTRVSKYTYGIATMKRFEPGIHSEQKRLSIHGRAYCDDIFEKHVTIGQEITVGQSMKEMTYHPTIDGQAHAILQVFASSKENPMYVTDEDCRQVGLLLVEMDTDGNRSFDINVKLILVELRYKWKSGMDMES